VQQRSGENVMLVGDEREDSLHYAKRLRDALQGKALRTREETVDGTTDDRFSFN
jgi:hypothetical protein